MTLVLNTLDGDYSEQIKALLAAKDSEVEIVNTAEMKNIFLFYVQFAVCKICQSTLLTFEGI